MANPQNILILQDPLPPWLLLHLQIRIRSWIQSNAHHCPRKTLDRHDRCEKRGDRPNDTTRVARKNTSWTQDDRLKGLWGCGCDVEEASFRGAL